MTKAEANRKMREADRERARLMYSCSDRVFDSPKLYAKHEARVRASAEYRKADEEFRKYSKIVGDAGPHDLQRMLRI